MSTYHTVRRSMERRPEVDDAYKAQIKRLNEQYNGNPPCPLCTEGSERIIIEDCGTMCVIENDFPYSVFDGLELEKHLMLVPKRHLATFADYNDQEQRDYWRALTDYGTRGYNSMTRSTRSHARSVPDHLHTHLFLHTIS